VVSLIGSFRDGEENTTSKSLANTECNTVE
jgi:hypothetical protein